jgi:hypothetical protein
LEESFDNFIRSVVPPVAVNVDTTLDPRKISTVSSNKLKDIRMVEIQM